MPLLETPLLNDGAEIFYSIMIKLHHKISVLSRIITLEFLVAYTRLYKLLSRLVGQSVGPSVGRSVTQYELTPNSDLTCPSPPVRD